MLKNQEGRQSESCDFVEDKNGRLLQSQEIRNLKPSIRLKKLKLVVKKVFPHCFSSNLG